MTAPPPSFIVPSTSAHTHTIILLHGRGSTGADFAIDLLECVVLNHTSPSPSPSLRTTNLPQRFPTCKWVFPSAKSRYSTVFREELTEWFDIVSLTDPAARQDLQKPGLVESARSLIALVREELQSVSADRLIVGGISQGYAAAALVFVALDLRIADFVGLSGWMPFAEELLTVAVGFGREVDGTPDRLATAVARDVLGLREGDLAGEAPAGAWAQTAIFLGQEKNDNVVACQLGQTARDLFAACGAQPVWRTYDSGDHWIQEPDEIADLVEFLDRCMTS